MNMGDQYAAMGDFASAELEYHEVIEGDNSDALAHDKRAVALAKDGRLEEALEENLKACALAPDVAQYHNNKGVTLYEMGMRKGREGNRTDKRQYYQNAVEACRIAVELDSTVADYHYNLAEALSSVLNDDDALLECVIALQLNPDNSEYHRCYANCLGSKGEYDKALNEARKAVELAPDNDWAYYTLAFHLELFNQFDEAASAYRQAIQLNPNEPAYHNCLAYILKSWGRCREALKEYEATIALSVIYPAYQQSVAYNNAANTLIELNRHEEALQYIEKAIELYPDYVHYHVTRYALLTYFNRHEDAARELQVAHSLGLSEDAKI